MTRLLLLTTAAGLLAAAAHAEDKAKPKKKEPFSADPEVLFKKLDTMGPSSADDQPDGKLSPAEFKALADMIPKGKGKKAADAAPPDLDKAFKLLDNNGDGFLVFDDFKNVGVLVPLTPPKKK